MDITKAFEEIISEFPLAGPKKMFGYDVYAANRKMFAWTNEDSIALTTLSEADRNLLIEKYDAYPYQHGNRVFSKWLIIPIPNKKTLTALKPIIRIAYEAAMEASLEPPKPRPKPRRPRLR
ncbi:MAG: hypothetical protein OEM52_09645 [bacterium]|nr:hypothetical protein [bacterium]